MQKSLIISWIIILIMAWCVPVLGNDILFESRCDWPVSIEPMGLCLTDLNGDGINDLAVGHNEDYTIAVRLGNGDGSFQDPVYYSSTLSAVELIAADLDADTDLDLVVYDNSTFQFLKNNGDGTFQSPTGFTPAFSALAIAMADIDNDNDADLIAPSYTFGNTNIYVYTNQGNGTFGPPMTYAFAEYITGICVGYYNNDAFLDFAVSAYAIDTIAVFLNNTSGGFGAPTAYESGDRPQAMSTLDIDNDSDDDFVVSCYNDGTIIVYENDGTGGFTAGTPVAAEAWVYDIAVGDLNDDSYPDIVLGGDSIAVLYNDTEGSFDPADLFIYGTEYPHFVACGKIDGDNSIDLAVIEYPYDEEDDPGFISTYYNRGDGSFMRPTFVDAVTQNTGICTMDVDNDTDMDIILSSWWTGSIDTVVVMINDGVGNFSEGNRYPAGLKVWSLTAVELTGDNLPDLVLGRSDNSANSIAVMINTGSGTFSAPVDYTTELKPTHVFGGDFDGDTYNDIAVVNYASQSISVLTNNGSGVLSAPSNITNGLYMNMIDGGKFNNDTYPDLVVPSSLTDAVEVRLNDGSGGFASATTYTVGDYPVWVHVADLDDDGDDDIISANNGSYDISILENDNFTTFNPAINIPVGVEPNFTRTADLNDDGLLDIIVINEYSSGISILLNAGGMNFTSHAVLGIEDYDPEDMCLADFDGDSDIDIAMNYYDGNKLAFYWNRYDFLTDADAPWKFPQIPMTNHLKQNYPNPFNPATTIAYRLSKRSNVVVDIYNLLGQKVRQFNRGSQPAGEYTVVWDGLTSDGRPAASGIYFYRLRTDDFTEVRKMILLK